ncbi:MAG: thermonuclease family protein [Nitrospiria bacterium]
MSRISTIFLLFFLLPTSVLAHQGPLDVYGCHHNKKLNLHECHEGRLQGQVFLNEEDQLDGFKEKLKNSGLIFGKVVAVIDGDTIKLWKSPGVIKIGLSGIDSPEKKQPYGEEAAQFLSDMVLNKYVIIKPMTGRHLGRVISEVLLPDGRMLSKELLKAGLAWWDKPHSKDASLNELQKEANRGKRGLWQEHDPVPPWKFREINKRKK